MNFLTVGTKIKESREKAGYSQASLGTEIRVTKQMISKIENGQIKDFERAKSTYGLIASFFNDNFGVPELAGFIKNNGSEEIVVSGRVVAGKPLQAIPNPGTIFVPKQMIAQNMQTFAVQVTGDSMRDVGILHKDIVVLHKMPGIPSNGTVVVARIGFGEAAEHTLKTWIKDGSKIVLKPENPEYDSIIIESNSTEVNIEGVFAGLIRFED